MMKDYTRDYTTAAFVFWARNGCPEYDSEVARDDPAVYDLWACDQCFRKLRESGREYICKAVREIYMVEPYRPMRQGDISARVLRFAMETPVSERQVYNWLSEARALFAELRGLRISSDDEKIAVARGSIRV